MNPTNTESELREKLLNVYQGAYQTGLHGQTEGLLELNVDKIIHLIDQHTADAVAAELRNIFVDAEIDDDRPTSDMKAHLVYEHIGKRLEELKNGASIHNLSTNIRIDEIRDMATYYGFNKHQSEILDKRLAALQARNTQ